MDLQSKLMSDMKDAMKAHEKVRLETIRGIRAQIKNRQIELGRELNDDDVLEVLSTAAKRRKESIEQFQNAGRQERVDEETAELEIIQSYLPEQMSEAEINEIVVRVIQDVNAESPKDMGKVMGKLMPQVKGKADGKLVQKIVQQKLSAL